MELEQESSDPPRKYFIIKNEVIPRFAAEGFGSLHSKITDREVAIKHAHHEHPPISYPALFSKFFLFTGLQVAAFIGIFAWVAPDMFRQEWTQPGMMILWAFAMGIPLSLFEYLYHRYLLHSAVLPFLGSMHRAHSHHHGLTAVKAPVTPKDPEAMVEVKSEYPILSEEQEESMMFPIYAISIFLALFLVLLALPFKLLFPGQPVILGVILCVTLCYSLYELWHQVLHLPFDRFWKPLMNKQPIRSITRYIYSFHLMHHWRPTLNLAVVGFWGVAVWDHLFGTHRRPYHLPIHGAKVNYHDASMRKPRWPISALDKVQPGLYKGSRRLENSIKQIFRRRSS